MVRLKGTVCPLLQLLAEPTLCALFVAFSLRSWAHVLVLLQGKAVGALSGGWKMKLALSRAILQKADILLLDEPTNHLDVVNVQWLMDYLKSMTSISSMIVSHDSNFLETVCTHIIHYENRKLKMYRGNLTKFVKQVCKLRKALPAQDLLCVLVCSLDGCKTRLSVAVPSDCAKCEQEGEAASNYCVTVSFITP